jgi:hypothetical protein
MTHLNRFRCSFLAMLALALIAQPVFAQQTVDPSGTCVVQSTNITIVGQTGSFVCYPSALGSATGTWMKVNHGFNTLAFTVNFNQTTLAAAAALTANVSLTTLPAGAVVLHTRIKPTVAWLGTATLTASVGDATSATAFTTALDLKAAVSNTALIANTAPKITTEAADAILLAFTATTNNLNVLSAGSLVCTLVYALPATGPSTVAWMLDGVPGDRINGSANLLAGDLLPRVIDRRVHGIV